MSGNPKPIVTPGTYQINIASLSLNSQGTGTLSNQQYNVQATFTPHTPTSSSDKKVQDFTFTSPTTGKPVTGSYDYSWGNKSTNSFIIGDGKGGYYVITSAVPGSSSSTIDGKLLLDPAHARYAYVYRPGYPWSMGNIFGLKLDGKDYLFRQDDDGTASTGASLGQSEQFTFNTCFLAGSLINTPEGPRKVEDLKRGDMVLTHDPVKGQTLPQAIIWVGRGHVQIDPSLPMDMAGYPVRVRKDALADNVPSEDLLVTAEHCLFFNGRFVPVRMMVNGQSIHFDMSYGTSYDIFHIETENHSIIFANDVMTESYLDTDNRHQLKQPGRENDLTNVIEHNFSTKGLSWQTDAAVPLCTAQDFVAPLYHDLVRRAETLHLPVQHPHKAETLSDDPDFHLVTDKGHVLHEKRTSEGYKMFTIPSGTKHLILFSKTGRPCDVHGPFVDDRRALGVLIGEILYFRGGRSITIDEHLTADRLDGWFDMENAHMRWTQGTAILPLPDEQYGSDELEIGMLAIKVLAGGPYPVTSENKSAASHSIRNAG